MIRVCPMRDARCPHGVDCPYVGDGPYGYPCKEGYNQVAARAERDRVMSTPEPLPIAFERASAENEGEPVAWRSRRRGSDDDWDLFFTKPAPRSDYEDQPLYARPDPAVERLQRELDEARAKANENWKLAEYERHDANHWHIQFEAATKALMPFAAMRLSTEPGVSDLVLRSPAEEMRRQAEAVEAHDRAILAARAILGDPP